MLLIVFQRSLFIVVRIVCVVSVFVCLLLVVFCRFVILLRLCSEIGHASDYDVFPLCCFFFLLVLFILPIKVVSVSLLSFCVCYVSSCSVFSPYLRIVGILYLSSLSSVYLLIVLSVPSVCWWNVVVLHVCVLSCASFG